MSGHTDNVIFQHEKASHYRSPFKKN